MADFAFVNKPWDMAKVRRMVKGLPLPDSEAGDGYADVPNQSYYQMRCAALDKGDPELCLDAIWMEQLLDRIDDIQERAAVTLVMCGMDEWQVGAAIRSNRTGSQLVEAGLKWLVAR